MGSIFRTADAALVDRIFCTGITGTPDHPAVHRTALGAQDVVPWEHARDPLPVLQRLRNEGWTLAAVEITDSPYPIEELALEHFPMCLIVGNEVDGVSNEVLQACQLAVEIPQYGIKQSLNVAVAYGVIVYDVVRKFRRLNGWRS